MCPLGRLLKTLFTVFRLVCYQPCRTFARGNFIGYCLSSKLQQTAKYRPAREQQRHFLFCFDLVQNVILFSQILTSSLFPQLDTSTYLVMCFCSVMHVHILTIPISIYTALLHDLFQLLSWFPNTMFCFVERQPNAFKVKLLYNYYVIIKNE